MPSTFPTTLDALATTKADGTAAAGDHPAHHNDLADAVNKVEAEVRVAAAFVVAASDSRRKRLADYVCDGTADQAEINTALGAAAALGIGGGTVLLLEGTYNLTASVSLPNAAVRLVGQGYATLLAMGASMTAAGVLVNGPTAASAWGTVKQEVAALRIDGSATNGANTGAHGLEVAGAVLNGRCTELWITNAKGHSVYAHGASGGERPAYCLFDHCNIQNGSRDGIHLGDAYPAGTYAEHNDVRNCVVTFHSGASTYGLYATGNNNRITDCQFDFLQTGLCLSGAAQNTVKGCTFDRSITSCVILDGQGNHALTDNFFSDHITSGGAIVNPATNRAVSQINGSSGNTFTGNHFLITGGASPEGTGWAYGFGEDSGCGDTANYGPSLYVGNVTGRLDHQFSGAPPLRLGNTGKSTALAAFLQLPEITDAAAGPTNTGRVYVRDNGAAKSQLVVRFPTGAIQVLATEP